MSIRDMIRATIREMMADEVSAAVRAEIGGFERSETDSKGRSMDDPNFGMPRGQTVKASERIEDRPAVQSARRSRKRGRGQAKVAYVLVSHGKGFRYPNLGDTNPGLVLAAMRRADEAVTNLELESMTELSNKAVQSAIHQLRTAGLVKSKALR